MSHPTPNDPPRQDAALGDHAGKLRDLPPFQPVSQIEREIARSERASAALAAVAALARASSGPDAEAAETIAVDLGSDAWSRTEYAPFDTLPAAERGPAGAPAGACAGAPDAPGLRVVDRRKKPRPPKPGDSLLGAFDAAPVAPMPAFPAPPVASARPARASAAASRPADDSGFGPSSGYSLPHADSRLGAASQLEPAAPLSASRARSGDTSRLLMAGMAGAAAVLVAGAAWKYGADPGGFLPAPSRAVPVERVAVPVAPPVAPVAEPAVPGANPAALADADAQTRRALAQSRGEIPLAAPAAGIDPAAAARNDAVAEALAAAARVLAVSRTHLAALPAEPVHTPAPVAAVAMPARGARAVPEQKVNVAAAVAQAQARADRFLGVGGAAAAPHDPAQTR